MDSDPEVPKTCESCGSGSLTLLTRITDPDPGYNQARAQKHEEQNLMKDQTQSDAEILGTYILKGV